MADASAGAVPQTPLRCLHAEVTCSICLSYYEHPVTADCGHSFCQNCFADRRVNDSEFTCPKCGQTSNASYFQVSTQLSKLTEIVKQMTLEANKMGLCDLHGERMTLFCKDDHTIMCVVCRDAKGHTAHTVISADEAAQECKDKKKQKQELIQHCFKKVHQFLNEEEKLLLRQLECKSDAVLLRLKRRQDSLSKNRSTVEEWISEVEAMIQKPALELLRVLTGSVTLDPDTAYVDLTVLEDGKRIGYINPKRIMLWEPPSSPGRCNFGPAVLGTGRFGGGKHYWEIEYEVQNDWEVGVCLDSVIRSHSVETHAYAECIYQNGIWTICTAGISYGNNPPARARIGIFLDYEAGAVTFYNVTANRILKTAFATFTGILRPYFEAHRNKQAGGLTMCPVPQRCAPPAISYIDYIP